MQNKLADAGGAAERRAGLAQSRAPGAGAGPELRAGLVGTGVIAEPHAACLRRIPGVTLAAVCDLDAPKAAAFAARWAIPESYGALAEMLARARLDAVHILLPPPAHAAAALACLEAGCHVFLEKPACLTTAECAAVAAAAGRTGRAAGVNHNLSYMPAYTRLLEAVRGRRLGAVEHVAVAYHLPLPLVAAGPHTHWMFQAPGNVVLEIGPHPASLIYPLVGRVREVSAIAAGEVTLTSGRPFYSTWQVSLVCERGTAQLYLSVGRDYLARWCYAVGQDGEAFADLGRNTLRLSEKSRYVRTGGLRAAWQEARELFSAALGDFFRGVAGSAGFGPGADLQTASMAASIGGFYAALRDGRPVPVDIREGAAVVETCERAIAAALGAGREARHAAV